MIEMFVQGESCESDGRLFSCIGRWLVDKEIQERLGNPVSADDGDIWWVALSDDGMPQGFATGRKHKNGAMHLRYVFCVSGNVSTCHDLIKQAVHHASEFGCVRIWTFDRPTAAMWKRFKFSPTAVARRTFVRWEKFLKENS